MPNAFYSSWIDLLFGPDRRAFGRAGRAKQDWILIPRPLDGKIRDYFSQIEKALPDPE